MYLLLVRGLGFYIALSFKRNTCSRRSQISKQQASTFLLRGINSLKISNSHDRSIRWRLNSQSRTFHIDLKQRWDQYSLPTVDQQRFQTARIALQYCSVGLPVSKLKLNISYFVLYASRSLKAINNLFCLLLVGRMFSFPLNKVF